MDDKNKIKIVSSRAHELSDKFDMNGNVYLAMTEFTGPKTCTVLTRIFLNGAIVFTKRSDCYHLTGLNNFEGLIAEQMRRQHKLSVNLFKSEHQRTQKSKEDYLSEARRLVVAGRAKSAYQTLKDGIASYPADPFIMSYYGYFLSAFGNKTNEGVELCLNAIERLNSTMPCGSEFYHPFFYLNLGRAYLRKDRQKAIKSFRTGLGVDPENPALRSEMDRLGTRRRPPIPFLKRSNVLNKYAGMVLNWIY